MKARWQDFPQDAPLPKVADPPAPRKPKPTLRRRTWVRVHHELMTRDVWGLVAEMARSERGIVEAFIVRLQAYANAAEPRGSVLGFNVAALAVTWRREKDELARVFAALEHPDVGWIEDDVIVTFWDDNPDEDDPTAAMRSKRSYHRRKLIKKLQARGAKAPEIIDELERAGLAYPQATNLTRENVSLTARADQNRQADEEAEKIQGSPPAEAPLAVHKDSGDSEDNGTALAWLAFEGQRLIIERLQNSAPQAQQRVERWLAEMAGDAIALAKILRGLQGSDLVGARFLVACEDARKRYRRDANGPQLPLPPALAADNRRRGHG